MKHNKKITILLYILACLIPQSTATNKKRKSNKPIIRTIAEFPQKTAEAATSCSGKAQTVAIETLVAQANHLFKTREYDKAIENYQQAITLQQDHVSAHYNLGLTYLAINDLEHAIAAFLRATELDPNHMLAHYFLGYAYQLQNKLDRAIACYDHVTSLDPDHFTAHLNKGRALGNLEQIDAAIQSYENALSIQENDLKANFELGYLHNRKGNLEQSAYYYKRAVEVDPDRAEPNYNLAHVLRDTGKMRDAIPFYKKVIASRPEHASAHCGLAECYLATGNYKEGFEHLEWRFNRMPDTRGMKGNRWDGIADLTDKTILVRAEFGQGDTIQFARYLPLLKQRGAIVILEIQHTLAQLFSHAPYIDQIIEVNDPPLQLPHFDYQIPIMSLPHVFNTELGTIPGDIPYIYTDKNLDEYWHKKLDSDKNIKIGICWEGSAYYEQFKPPYSKKAIPLTAFEALTKLPGVTVYSLQKMNGTEQLHSLSDGMIVHDFGESFDIDHGRFMDTASLIKKMDLIISTDTSVAHLAGALGAPTWILLPYAADWRWLKETNETPWYPTAKLFRQQSPQDWQLVINEVVKHLEKKLYGSNTIKQVSPFAEVSIGELIDKMTILEIKSERIQDKAKLRNIANEQRVLKDVFDNYVTKSNRTKKLFSLMRELKAINEKLWDIEDNIREKEAHKSFDSRFIELARSVYFSNDERGRVKREINDLLGSRLVEEKVYKSYK